jgi:hypothetical protein
VTFLHLSLFGARRLCAHVYGFGFVRGRRWLSSYLTVNAVEEVSMFGYGLVQQRRSCRSARLIPLQFQTSKENSSYTCYKLRDEAFPERGDVVDSIKGTYTASLVS